MILLKAAISPHYFQYFEAIVGAMLIILGIYRLVKFFLTKKIVIHTHGPRHQGEAHKHLHVHLYKEENPSHPHSLAYGVGLIHGLAGSGALILIVMNQMKGPFDGMAYLIIFGAGCISGMMLAAGFFSIPFSKKLMQVKKLQSFLIIASSLLCVLYGGKVLYENLIV